MIFRNPLKKLITITHPPHSRILLRNDCNWSYNLVSTDKATYLLRKAQFNVYDSGDKASKRLAQQARQNLSYHLIPKIHSEIGELITSQVEIITLSKNMAPVQF